MHTFRETLKQWPFEQNKLLETPDPEIIEANARYLLSRALSIGRLCAFVSSGVSSSYGRVSWTTLAKRVKSNMLLEARKIANLTDSQKPSGSSTIELSIEHLESLPENTDPYTLFQSIDQLNKLLIECNPSSQRMRSIVRNETESDVGYSKYLLKKWLSSTLKTSKLSEDDRLDKVTAIEKAAKLAPFEWGFIKQANEVGTKPIPPYLRHLLINCPSNFSAVNQYLEKLSTQSESHLTRAQIISPSRDPLLLLLRRLKIRRFMTLNYDSEIERLFRDEGFRPKHIKDCAWKDKTRPIEPSSPESTVLVFDKNKVGELTAFALDHRDPDVHVVYLHGRAHDGPESLILSHDDYLDRYASDDQLRDSVDEALYLAYGTHPLLFVGVGMSEEDILYQLRTQMSLKGKMVDRANIAILPAKEEDVDDNNKKTREEKTRLLQRYGVYTIHYGYVQKDGKSLNLLGKIWRSLRFIDQSDAKTDRSKIEELNDGEEKAIRAHFDGFDISIVDELKYLKKIISAYKSNRFKGEALEHLNSFQNAFLCRELISIGSDLVKWRENWFKLPLSRPLDCYFTSDENHVEIGMTTLASKAGTSQRFYPGIASAAFSKLAGDIEKVKDGVTATRLFFFYAKRGVGRGHFMSAMKNRLTELQTNFKRTWSRSFFANFTHSNEVASIFDALIIFLDPNLRSRKIENYNRLAWLKKALAEEGENSLVVLNGVHMFIDDAGRPKNSQLSRLLVELMGTKKCTIFLIAQDVASFRSYSNEVETPNIKFDLHETHPLLFAHYYFPKVAYNSGQPSEHQTDHYARELIESRLAHGVDLPGINSELVNRVYKIAGRCRFRLGLILTALEVGLSDSANGSSCNSEFIGRIEVALQMQARSRGDKLIGMILDEYFERHRRKTSVDKPLDAFTFFRADLDKILLKFDRELAEIQSRLMSMELQRSVLWALSVIGQPVSISVLLMCPNVAESLGFLGSEKAASEEVKSALLVVLKEMRERCFVMPLSEERFGVHRSVQAYFLSRLGAPRSEYWAAEQFTVTMYASQSKDLPVITPAAHAQLRLMIGALSGYPGAKYQQKATAESLRAALAILRTVYSLAVTSRFDASHAESALAGLDIGPEGFLEDHRLLVRWVYKQACYFSDNNGNGIFFEEELAWLCNEAGVISLVQGKLNDSLALLELAKASSKRFEFVDRGKEKGSIGARVLLNRCICEIERGKLAWAEENLRNLLKIADETWPFLSVTLGYLALVMHLRGRTDQAMTAYEAALYGDHDNSLLNSGIIVERIATVLDHRNSDSNRAKGGIEARNEGNGVMLGLIALGRSRACSIFSRHYGELIRFTDPQKSRSLINSAIAFASEGGHEDVRHLALAARIRWSLLSTAKSEDEGVLLAQVKEIERYAIMMGIPRLLVESYELRARVHKSAGDLQAARKWVIRALRLASMYDLRLRKASFLVLLGRIHHSFRDFAACRAVASAALGFARGSDHTGPMVGAQRLLSELDTAGF